MDSIKNQMQVFNMLSSENELLYHTFAQRYGLSDNVFWTLYCLYQSDSELSQSDLCGYWSFSKQTINSSVNVLIKKGWVKLETVPNTRNRKNILLTEAGRKFCDCSIREIIGLELSVYARFSQEERETFIKLFRSLNNFMWEELEKLDAGKRSE